MQLATSLRLSVFCWITKSELCVSSEERIPSCSHRARLEQYCWGDSVWLWPVACVSSPQQGLFTCMGWRDLLATCAILFQPVNSMELGLFQHRKSFKPGVYDRVCDSQWEQGTPCPAQNYCLLVGGTVTHPWYLQMVSAGFQDGPGLWDLEVSLSKTFISVIWNNMQGFLSQLEDTLSSLFTAYLSFKFQVVRGWDPFKDVIRKMKSKVKPPNL